MICRSADASVQPGTAAAAASKILYVTQLDNAIKGDQLTSHFKAQPGFESAFIMDVDDEDGRQQHLGFVQFSNAEAAAAAQKALDGSELSQQRIRVRSQRGGKAGSGDKGSRGAEQAAAQPSAAQPSPPSTPQAADPATTPQAASNNTTTPVSLNTSTTSSTTTSPSAASGSNDSQGSSEQAVSTQDGAAASPEGADEKATAAATSSRSKAYRQRQRLPPASPSTLFVPSLRQNTTKEELAEHFRDQPGVESVMVRLAMGRRQRYDGYVQFTSPENATAAMQALAGTELNSKPLRIFIHEGPGRKRTKEPEAAAAADSASGADSVSGVAEQPKPKPKQPRKQPQTQGSSKAASTASSDAAQAEASSSDSSSSSTQEDSSSSSRKKKVRIEARGQSFSLKVLNLAWSTTRDSLDAHFKDCKDYTTCVTIPSADGRPSGVGYVRFSTAAGAQAALEAKQESELDGRTIRVMVPEPRAARPAADSGSSGRAAWALQVFNLAYDATEQDLLDHFGGCKGFQGAFIATGRDNRPSGTGFVVFDSEGAQAAAYKAKQGTELVGRKVFLRSTRPGRVEAAGEDSSAADTPADTAAAAAPAVAEVPAAAASSAGSNTQPSALVLFGLPPSFTWREVMGLCSFFGDVRNVTRMRSDIKSSDGTNNTGAAAEAGVASSPDQARQGQPSFVNMDSAEAAGRAVAALNGHTVQGHKLVAGLAPRKKAKVGAGKQQDNAEQTPST